MSDSPIAWEPAVGDRVLIVQRGETATILQLALTEWGLLCDLEIDRPPGAGGRPTRRVHAATELRLPEG